MHNSVTDGEARYELGNNIRDLATVTVARNLKERCASVLSRIMYGVSCIISHVLIFVIYTAFDTA